MKRHLVFGVAAKLLPPAGPVYAMKAACTIAFFRGVLRTGRSFS